MGGKIGGTLFRAPGEDALVLSTTNAVIISAIVEALRKDRDGDLPKGGILARHGYAYHIVFRMRDAPDVLYIWCFVPDEESLPALICPVHITSSIFVSEGLRALLKTFEALRTTGGGNGSVQGK